MTNAKPITREPPWHGRGHGARSADDVDVAVARAEDVPAFTA
jgi:hypothetical protein